MKLIINIVFCLLIILAIFSVASAVDEYVNMEELSNIQIGKSAYIWGWYEPDSANYFVFSGLWNNADGSKGWFIEPTLILTTDPHFKLMEEEIFGPVMTVYVYEDAKFEETLRICDSTSPYALTGAIFARDKAAIIKATDMLRHAAGNFYINDKPTGAVVGQQPFGGGRAAGTNDKAGSLFNMIRWTSPRTIKENFAPPTDFKYPFLG